MIIIRSVNGKHIISGHPPACMLFRRQPVFAIIYYYCRYLALCMLSLIIKINDGLLSMVLSRKINIQIEFE